MIDILSHYSYIQINIIIIFIMNSKIHNKIRKSYHENNFFKSIIENSEQYLFYIIQDNNFIYLHDNHFYIPNSKFIYELLLHQYHDNENHFDIKKSY